MRIFGLLGVLCLLSTPSFADDALFGLRWGENMEDIKRLGVSGDLQQYDGHLTLFQVTTLPHGPNDTKFASLGIDRRFGLQRIQWISKDIADTPSGEKGIALYKTMKRALSDQYGDPKSSDEEIVGSPNQSSPSLYRCLAEDGCGVFVTVWRTPDTDARLRLMGSASGKGWLEVVLLGPDWSDIVSENKVKDKR